MIEEPVIRHRHRRRGNILIIAVVLMLILVTLVGALHHYEVTSRRAANDSEADLAMIQSKKWALGVALGKASSSEAPSLPVTLSPTYTNATVMTPANAGSGIFGRDGNGDWDGLPNLTITRQDDPKNPALPPNFTEMTLAPKSVISMIGSMGKYRELVTDQMPIAAYAPKGNVKLEGCWGWANPEFGVGDKPTRQMFSGLPTIVAAGGNVSFRGDFPHGTAYSASNDTNAITINGTSLASRVVGPLPFGKTDSIDGVLITQLDVAANELENTAKQLDDKTQQISGTPPELTEIIDFFFSDCISGDAGRIKNRLMNWLSVRCATEFPFVSIPGFATTAFPFCYVAFQFWFHGPHPPDTVGYSSTGAPSDAVTNLYKKRAEYTEAKGRVEYLLSQLDGGTTTTSNLSSMPGAGAPVYKPRGDPNCPNFDHHPTEPPYSCPNCTLGDSNTQVGTAPSTPPPSTATVTVGLIDRFKSDTQMMKDVKADVTDLENQINNKDTSLKTNTRTKQDVLMWLGDCMGYLYDDSGNKAATGVSGYAFTGVNGFGSISSVDYSLRPPTTDAPEGILRHGLYNADSYVTMNNALNLSKTTFSHQKDWQGNDMGVRDTTSAAVVTRKFTINPNVTMRAGDAITTDMWNGIIKKKDGSAGNARDQLKFLKYLIVQSESPSSYQESIYFKIRKLRDDLANQKTSIQQGIDGIDTAIATLRGPVETLQERLSKLPMSRKEEGTKEPFKSDTDFQKDKGMIGMSYLRFGFSFDVMYKIIAWLASSRSDMDDLWTTRVPLVWWGGEDNKSPLNLANVMDIKGSFVIPAGRTFYYSNPVTITGTLWVQRGATMVVKGDLNVINSLAFLQGIANVSGTADDIVRYITTFAPGQAAGKVVLEEGASIVVRGGDMKVDGPLQVTGAMNLQRPITSAILVPDGRVILRQGTSGGLTLSDAFTWKELGNTGKDLNKYVIHPYLYAFAPNAAKIYGLGPFKRRKCFFARWATQYQLEIFIGPFGIPIPVMHPWPIPRDNIQVTLYKGLSYFYSVLANVDMGENLQTSTAYMPIVPVLPKIDFTATGITGIDWNDALNKLKSISMPSFDADEIKNFVKKLDPSNGEMWSALCNDMLADVVRDVMISMIPAPWNIAVSAAMGAILPPRSNDTPSGPMATALGGFSSPLTDLAANLPGYDALNAVKDKVFTGMLRDVHGALIFGKTVLVGYDTSGSVLPNRATFASGFFVARNQLGMNCDYTVGSMICATGNIDAPHTKLLHLPQFTRASLQNPDRNPKITSQLSGVPQFLKRAMDVEYGPYQNHNQTGLDVGYPRKWVMTEGWDR